ncbi:MAG: sensor histidine kinase [Microbacterium sp.]|nr:sensor histidine kinase [Microbacterium sp.]
MPEEVRTTWAGGPPWMSRRARLIVPVAIALLVQGPASVWGAVRVGGEPWRLLLHVALAFAGPLVLLAARRFPGPVVALVTAFAVVDVLTTPVYGPPYVALGFAIVGAVVRGAAVWAAASAVTGWALALIVVSFSGRDWHPPIVVAATVALAACFGVGAFARARRIRFAAARVERQRQRQSAEERERLRIARELHDVLGHALSQITVQAGVGLHLFDRDPEQARSALAHVKETSKLALDEVREVLGVLRDGETPLTPETGIGELPRLVAGAAGPDLVTMLDDRLDGDLPDRATQLAAYRIVQEALTNAIRHAGAARIDVTLDRGPDGTLTVAVSDDGRGLTGGEPAAGHRGLLGMQERAALLGGSVRVGARPGGGTEVVAVLPWRASAQGGRGA